MSAQLELRHETAQGLRPDLSERWHRLCSRYLPLVAPSSIWLHSRKAGPGDPEQGWKLHVSATILTACSVLEKIAPILVSRDIRFKGPRSLTEVQRINSGLYYGYSQVGKVFTVYPHTSEEAVSIAQQLNDALFPILAPAVPFDEKLSPGGCVYYRYGAFKRIEIENADGTRTPAILDPQGQLVADLRETASPPWASTPFTDWAPELTDRETDSPLKTTYRAFRALTRRGRGGVYEAIDVSSLLPRLCIIKEGRCGGELSWDGRDGAWKVRNEERILQSLRMAGVEVPRVYASFILAGNNYLVTEFIAGETLHAFLLRRQRRLSLTRALRLGRDVASLLARIHADGWAWRDCKPSNIMMLKTGALRPIDFEGACLVSKPDSMPWGTRGFRPRWLADSESRVYEDLYALGATLHLLLTGRIPDTSTAPDVGRLRKHVPPEACQLIKELLTEDCRMLTAQNVVERVIKILYANSQKMRRRVAA